MKINKEYMWIILKHLTLFTLLICATFLLLQIPALYYKKADSELLLKKGQSVYQLKSVDRNFILFSEKVKLFRNEYFDFALGEFQEFTEAEVTQAEEMLAGELDAMFDTDMEPLTVRMEESSLDSRGFRIAVMDYTQEQVRMWDIGFLFFREESLAWSGIVIYDADSGKIFLVNCDTPGAWGNVGKIGDTYSYEMEAVTDQRLEKIQNYYDGVEVTWEECPLIFGDAVFVSPFTSWELERSSLLGELVGIYEDFRKKYYE